jgi:hypothetical protein
MKCGGICSSRSREGGRGDMGHGPALCLMVDYYDISC